MTIHDTTSAAGPLPPTAAPRARRGPRSLAGRLGVFLALAYGLSWWPWPLSDLETQPDAALMVPVGPSVAAVILAFWWGGPGTGRALLRSLLHVRVGRWWWVLLLPVAIAGVSALVGVLCGASVPSRADVASAVIGAVVSLPLLLVVGGPLGEELGWRGFALPDLLHRFRPVAASLLLALMWIPFHLPWILNKPQQFGPAWALAVLGMTLTMTLVYLRTGGSLAVAVVLHAVINTATPAAITLFPERDRGLVWSVAAALWLLSGLTAAARMSGHGGTARTSRSASHGARWSWRDSVARHPVAWFLVPALGIGWGLLGPAVALDLPITPYLIVANLGGLLGTALLVTAGVDGRAGVRALLGGVVRWRIGWLDAGACLLAIPVVTVAVAVATGTLAPPEGGWAPQVASYVATTLVTGVLLFNLWEETAWAGFVQTRLAERHGTAVGAVLTALPFAGIHLPLAFVGHPPAVVVAVNIAALVVVAVVFRLLAGVILVRTGGSVLAVAVMHAAFNSSGSLAPVEGTWQSLVALALVTGVAGLWWRRQQTGSRAALH